MTINPLELFRKNRLDLSNFLIHLTKNGSYEHWEEMTHYKGHYLFKNSETINAEKSLISILKANPPTLLARSPFGIFKVIGLNVGKKTKMDIPLEWLKCACFSETPLRELKSFYTATQDQRNWKLKTNHYQKFGLAFETEKVRTCGGHPVFYYDRRQPNITGSIEKLGEPQWQGIGRPLLPFCEPYGPKILESTKEIDFRWEREWRIVGDFEFSLKEVAFGICPEESISKFESIVGNAFPFIDPDWEIDQLKQYLESKGWKQLSGKI